MAILIPPEYQSTIPMVLNRLGGTFERWLQGELDRTLMNLADAHDDVVLRQQQGRARCLRDLLEAIRANQI